MNPRLSNADKEKEPLVSVIVPNYNAGSYMEDFLATMRAQTYKNWELLVVDDNSTDNSPQTVRKHMEVDPRIKFLVCPDNNHGACQRRNQGLDQASGEYVLFFDSDDLLPDFSLEARVRELESRPDLDFLVSPAISFINKPYDIRKLALGIPIFPDDLKMFLCRFRLPFGVWTNTYRKSFFDRTGLRWDERLSSLQDSDLNIRALAGGARYAYSHDQRPAYYWRVGGNPSSITKNIKSRGDLESQLYFHSKLKERFEDTPYRKDVRRFGLTLLNRLALCQYQGEAPALLDSKLRKTKFRLLRSLYAIPFFRKAPPLVNLLVSPLAIGKEYAFLLQNRRVCRKFINQSLPS